MSQYQSELLRVMEERGYVHQMTDAAGLDALAARQVVPGYIGFDATAPSLHVGSLVQIDGNQSATVFYGKAGNPMLGPCGATRGLWLHNGLGNVRNRPSL